MAVVYPTMLVFTLLAGVIGGPLGAGLMKLDGVGGLRGWRWLFLCEGLATVALAAALPWLVPESIGTSTWLTADEKEAAAADVVAAARAAGVRAPETGLDRAPHAPADAETLGSALATAARVLGVWQIWWLGSAVVLCQVRRGGEKEGEGVALFALHRSGARPPGSFLDPRPSSRSLSGCSSTTSP
jgi:MFS family permease